MDLGEFKASQGNCSEILREKMNFQNLQNWEVEIRTGGIQGSLLRQREFRASLGYMKPIYKQTTFPSRKVFSFLKYQAEFPGN